QEIADFISSIIENERAPIHVLAQPRIGVLVKVGAVEFRKAVRVFWKMSRHPIDDHAEAALVTAIDEIAELVGCTKAAGRREIAGDLVAPRTVEGMFGDGH